ncbi:YchJ family metal-binding protein, partial [Kaistella sp.]|uniref:YchJ family metal-binding protein n=1 Tax=Kaistella sp. TaxID=2782235 RepID=UPI002F926E5F
WTKLEILKSTLNQVEFKAYYNDENGKPQIHHEHSLFKNLNGRWYYVSGKFID